MGQKPKFSVKHTTFGFLESQNPLNRFTRCVGGLQLREDWVFEKLQKRSRRSGGFCTEVPERAGTCILLCDST